MTHTHTHTHTQVSTTVTIEFPASVGDGESDEEYALLGLMGKKKEEGNGKGENGVLVSGRIIVYI